MESQWFTVAHFESWSFITVNFKNCPILPKPTYIDRVDVSKKWHKNEPMYLNSFIFYKKKMFLHNIPLNKKSLDYESYIYKKEM